MVPCGVSLFESNCVADMMESMLVDLVTECSSLASLWSLAVDRVSGQIMPKAGQTFDLSIC